VTGLVFIFIVGAVLYATRALTPPMLQSLMDYPVAMVGLVTAPSGAGTMLAMLIVGRMVGKVDLRALLLGGFAVVAFSLWQMTGYTLVLSESDIVWPGVIQGVGLGLPFAKTMFELHGGSLAIHSTQSIGTTVTIELPLAVDTALHDAA